MKESELAKTANLTRKCSELACGELTQLDCNLSNAKKACLLLKTDLASLPHVNLEALKRDIETEVERMQDAKKEFEKTVAYRIETRG